MNDKITENNDLNGNVFVANDNSNINVTPLSSVDSYNASVNMNSATSTNAGSPVNNSVYTMNDINNMSGNGQMVDNGNFTMVNKTNVNANNIPTVQVPNATGAPNIIPMGNDGTNNGVTITEDVVSSSNSSQVEEKPTITVTPVTGDEPPTGGGGGKTILLILFFITLFAFILFLPNISEIINTGNLPFKKTGEVQNGILICSMENETDITDTTYEMKFTFQSKKLIQSTLNVTVDSEDKSVVNGKNAECQMLREIPVEGIEVLCTLSGSVNNTKYNYNYQMIDNNNLTKFTEAGGVYPEHKYKENIYDIQSNMIKNGYNCEIRGN